MLRNSKYHLHKSIIKKFLLLLVLISVIFLGFAYFTYSNSRKSLQHELLFYNKQQTKRIATSIDDNILRMRYIMATLYNNSTTRIFINNSDLNQVIDNGSKRIMEQLNAYKNSYDYIDSIYLFSPMSRQIMTSSFQIYTFTSFKDLNWQNHLTDTNKAYELFARKKYNRYPFLVTLSKILSTSKGPGAIILNIDLSKMSDLSAFQDSSSQKFFIITDEGEILYQDNQNDILEPISTIPELKHYSSDITEQQIFIDKGSPYIYTQYHSSDYLWSYVQITYITDYTVQLTSKKAFLFTVFFFLLLLSVILIIIFVFRSTRPFLSIVRFIENPSTFSSQKLNDKESKEIIQKIMTYIQTSQNLTKEMEKQLKLLDDTKYLALQSQINPHFLFNTLHMIRSIEIEALGYEHQVPQMTLTLSKLLRYAIDSTDLVSLNTELYYTRLFISILDMRYQHRIQFHIVEPKESEDILIPKLIIQPLIENAVFHGLSNRTNQENRLLVDVTIQNEICILTIQDNGVGISEQDLESLKMRINDMENTPSNSIGLHNVNLRMHLLYGNQFHSEIQSQLGIGTTIRLYFPFMK